MPTGLENNNNVLSRKYSVMIMKPHSLPVFTVLGFFNIRLRRIFLLLYAGLKYRRSL